MGQNFPISVPAILPDRESADKTAERESGTSNSDSSTLAGASLVPGGPRNASCTPLPLAKLKTNTTESRQRTPSNDNVGEPKTSGISYLKQLLETKGISGNTAEIMLKAKKDSTAGAYAPCWGKWVLWCGQRKIDPVNATVKDILLFLTSLFENGLQYRTIGVYRSAISAYHRAVEGKPVGQHPDICTFMGGVDNLRPPMPRYCIIWEVDNVLHYLQGQEDSSISDKDLTMKTAMLLALAAVKRASELHLLDTSYMAIGESKIVFQLGEKPKHLRKKGKRPDPIEYFSSGQNLCPVKTLKSYLNRSKPWRGSGDSKVFLSFIKPHKAVTTSTISRWLKIILANTGVDT